MEVGGRRRQGRKAEKKTEKTQVGEGNEEVEEEGQKAADVHESCSSSSSAQQTPGFMCARLRSSSSRAR